MKILDYIQKMLSKVDLTDDDSRIHFQFMSIFLILSSVSAFMTVFNSLTGWHSLGKLTLLYSIFCAIDFIIEKYLFKYHIFGRIAFCIETVAIFSMFAIVGEPEGFSVLWTLLLPSCGFFLFRRTYGLIISTMQLVVLIFLYWLPWCDLFLADVYTQTFKQRFPILYISFYIVGYMFEAVRKATQNELVTLKDKYETLYNHDMLTGLYNRYGFNSTLDEFVAKRKDEAFAFAIIDLDYFKNVNDIYGHQCGDMVLKEAARRILEGIDESDVASRWGGEEFSILFTDSSDADIKCQKLLERARSENIRIGEDSVNVKFSMGITYVKQGQKIDISQLVIKSDNNLYRAKQEGRNRIVSSEY